MRLSIGGMGPVASSRSSWPSGQLALLSRLAFRTGGVDAPTTRDGRPIRSVERARRPAAPAGELKVQLPVRPPVARMLATAARALPTGRGLVYEPKWDGFRCIVFKDSAEIELGSRHGRPLTRYFPELVSELADRLPGRCVIDGEIVIAGPGGLDFDALLQRIHPAESRVRKLASETPASFVAFDLWAVEEEDLRGAPFSAHRERLEQLLSSVGPPVHLTPAPLTRRRRPTGSSASRVPGSTAWS